MNTAVHVTDYDPFAEAVMADPMPFYKELRRASPIHYLEKYDTFAVSRFQDVIDVLSIGDNAFIASDTTLPNAEQLKRHNGGVANEWPRDPMPIGALLSSPHYEILRQAHIQPLRPRAVKELDTFVRELANQRLDELLPRKRFDLTQDYGGIVSASVICRLHDMPLDQAADVLKLVNELSLTSPDAGGSDIMVTIGRCLELMLPHIARRRALGADGSVPLIDGLVSLEHDGRQLTDAEIATQLTCVFIGGTETVPKIVAHGLMELADAPGQLAAVRIDLDASVPVVIEEMIRYCAPAQWFCRTAHKDVTVAGQEIKIGQRVLVLFGSAARDEQEFEQPDAFIWNRTIRRVLSFGFGQHHCIGVHLARLEMRILVQEFLKRVPSFSFDMASAVRSPSSFQWGWNSLPVIVG